VSGDKEWVEDEDDRIVTLFRVQYGVLPMAGDDANCYYDTIPTVVSRFGTA
jgi:hypothetical protein